jgi:hypothetical protein
LHLLAGAQQPENDEEGHHGRDKVGISDFPGASVMAGVVLLLLDDDDWRRRIFGFGHS